MSTQIANTANRDLIGSQNNTYTQVLVAETPMTSLIKQYASELAPDTSISEYLENLQHYLSNHTVSDIRSLEQKLTISNRIDLIEDGILKKQNAAKFILKNQNSRAAQNIMAHILAGMAVNFDLLVKPLVQENQPRSVVDSAIYEKVILPSYKALESNPLGLHIGTIQDFLYFLAGNCHVRWDPC